MTPGLTSLLAQIERELATLDPQEIPDARGVLARLDSILLGRLLAPRAGLNGNGGASGGDRLLTVEEAGKMLGMTKDYLYHHAKKLPFAVRPAPRQLRFSSRGIERFIRQRMGK